MATLEMLAEAALQRDNLQLRSLVQDFLRADTQLDAVPRPRTNNPCILTIAAALVELLAQRTGQAAPAWTREVDGLPEPFFLLEAATRMKRLRVLCETESPEPLRKRGLYAPPDFLSFA